MDRRETTFSFDETAEARNCLFAVPKKGRLFDKVSKILAGTGLDFEAQSSRCRALHVAADHAGVSACSRYPYLCE